MLELRLAPLVGEELVRECLFLELCPEALRDHNSRHNRQRLLRIIYEVIRALTLGAYNHQFSDLLQRSFKALVLLEL